MTDQALAQAELKSHVWSAISVFCSGDDEDRILATYEINRLLDTALRAARAEVYVEIRDAALNIERERWEGRRALNTALNIARNCELKLAALEGQEK